jgi:hypothetical protein
MPGCPSPNIPDPVFGGCVVLGCGGGKSPLEAKNPLGCCVLLWPSPAKDPPDPDGCEVLWFEPIPEKRPPEGADIVVEGPKSEDEGPVVVVVLPNSELFVAAFWAVSPDGAKILVLLFAG